MRRALQVSLSGLLALAASACERTVVENTKVVPAPIAGARVSIAYDSLTVGTADTLFAVPVDANGRDISAAGTTTFALSNPALATLTPRAANSAGLFGLAPGALTVTVTFRDNASGQTFTGNRTVQIRPQRQQPATLIAFESNRVSEGSGAFAESDVFRMNVDGSNQLRLTSDPATDRGASWSPDRTRIVFESDRDRDFDLYVINADGSGLRRLNNTVGADVSAEWSPDGSRIAFQSIRSGNWEIYTMQLDGNNVRQLTSGPAIDASPTWSPDGSRIAFQTNRDGNWEIYTMNADGTNLQNVTRNAADDTRPAWSPDGSRILFTSVRGTSTKADVYVVATDGSGLRNLTNHPADDRGGSWSADGSRIVFETDRDANFEIYVMNADGTNPGRLTTHPVGDYNPAWLR